GLERMLGLALPPDGGAVRIGPLPLAFVEGACRVDVRVRDGPDRKASAAVSGMVDRSWPEPPAGKGWFGEAMPKGIRRAPAKPFYIYETKGLALEMAYVPPGAFV